MDRRSAHRWATLLGAVVLCGCASDGDPAPRRALGRASSGAAPTRPATLSAQAGGVVRPAAAKDDPCTHGGDVNGDGLWSTGDAQLAFQYSLEILTPNEAEACAADCNGDNVISSGDALLIFLAGLGNGSCPAELVDGHECTAGTTCRNRHCQNGFCCAAGDCCDGTAASCPAGYDTLGCDDAVLCQGTRRDTVCTGFACASGAPVADDSACGPGILAADCAAPQGDIYCTGAADQTPRACGTGATCAAPLDVSRAAFPARFTGSFTDDPAAGGSCGGIPWNAVWFRYVAPATGSYRIFLYDHASTSVQTRAAVFAGTGCAPPGPEVACATSSSKSLSLTAEFVAGTSYLILFHSDGSYRPMVDPEITVAFGYTDCGTSCAEGCDVTGADFPVRLVGSFTEEPPLGDSCGDGFYNAAHFLFTPPTTAPYEIVLTDNLAGGIVEQVVFAVFEGAGCDPYGPEVSCAAHSWPDVMSIPRLTAGTPYRILFHAEQDDLPMIDPAIDIHIVGDDPGEICDVAVDVSGETFPFALAGDFGYEIDPGPGCDSSLTNAVWFRYTPPADDLYQIVATNPNQPYGTVRLAIQESAACAPLGPDIGCVNGTGTASLARHLRAGTEYLIVFFAAVEGTPMQNPTISIAPLTPGPGQFCVSPIDVTGATFPYVATGSFSDDPQEHSTCSTSPQNAAWFTYTAPTTDLYRFTAQNGATGNGVVLALFDGDACAPLGFELDCVYRSATNANLTVDLAAGQTILVLFHTSQSYQSMTNPQLTVEALGAAPGASCRGAYDVTGATFPVTLTGTFAFDPPYGGPCDTVPTNAVFFRYTAPTSGTYALTGSNANVLADSRLVVFAGVDCDPYDAAAVCSTEDAPAVTALATFEAAETYLILMHTGADGDALTDPTLAIALIDDVPGALCETPFDLSRSEFPAQVDGDFDDDPLVGSTCDPYPTNAAWFTYTPPSTGDYEVLATNANPAATSTTVALFEGDGCNPRGAQLACEWTSGAESYVAATLVGGTSYLLLVHAGSEATPLVDPTVTVQPRIIDPGEACTSPSDLTGADLPLMLPGLFNEDDGPQPSCTWGLSNAVFYTFTPDVSGTYWILAENGEPGATLARLAVYEGAGCAPPGAELACADPDTPWVTTDVALSAGTTYLIVFSSSAPWTPMRDPQIDLGRLGDEPGETCADPADVTGASFPVAGAGLFIDDPIDGHSCDDVPANAAYYTFTPPTAGAYHIAAQNGHPDGDAVYLALFAGTSCAPFDAEVACRWGGLGYAALTSTLTADTPYLILFHTSYGSLPMAGPQLWVDLVGDAPGEACTNPYDVSGASFPVTLDGGFGDAPPTGTSCDSAPDNAVWFTFTPPTSASYTLTATNAGLPNTWSRLAVFAGTGCAPYGTELACVRTYTASASATLWLAADEPYLVLFHTQGSQYPMVDPTLDVQ